MTAPGQPVPFCRRSGMRNCSYFGIVHMNYGRLARHGDETPCDRVPIEAIMDKVWEIPDPDERPRRRSSTTTQRQEPARSEKDPAKAYSLSVLVWGLGQLYTDQLVKGAVFMVVMLLVVAGTVLSLAFWDTVLVFLVMHDRTFAGAFLVAEVLLFCVLLFWTYNAGDAYHHAARARKARFRGVASRVTPLLTSACIPGWGQFLNGQPFKGGIYRGVSVLGIFSVITIPAVILAWPFLEDTGSRFIIEGIFAVSVLLVPLFPLLWAISCHDAFKVSRDDLLKEPLWERVKAAYYRGRTQGWVRGIMPQIKGTFMLALYLVFALIVIHYYFPKGFYADLLTHLRTSLSEQGMAIVPELMGKLLAVLRS